MCVCFHSIYSGRLTCGRTSRGHIGGRSHRIYPPFFCVACLNYFLLEKDSAVSLSPVDRYCCCCCILHINRSGLNHTPVILRGCQSGTWSQRGTEVNGSHHGDNPLLRPTGIQIATKSYATVQAMAPTNIKTVRQTSLLHIPRASSIDSDCCRLPTTSVLSNKPGTTFQPVLINKSSKFIKATHRTEIRKIEIPRSMVVEALSW